MKTKFMACLAMACLMLLPAVQSQASIHNFSVTFDGTMQTVDAGSDAVLGATFNPGDGFILDFHAAGNDSWLSQGGSSGIYLAFLVQDGGIRTYDYTATFFNNGVQVAQDVRNGGQAAVHMGAQQFNMAAGIEFDQIILDYSLLNHTGSGTEIQNDFVFWSFTGNANNAASGDTDFAVYQSGVPEPTTCLIWSVLAASCLGLRNGRRRKR